MLVKWKEDIVFRLEEFGASVYVRERDDIFLLDKSTAKFLSGLNRDWAKSDLNEKGIKDLARFGIIYAKLPNGSSVLQGSYSGIHLLGNFKSIPFVKDPLLVNCFATSWCPLKCVYCHADDLMTHQIREDEVDHQIERVVEVTRRMRALTYVVTGGDPLTKPKRSIELLEKLPGDSGTVIDTSGVGKVEDMTDILSVRPSHVRISIDSMDPRINRKTRPGNKPLFSGLFDGGKQSLDFADKMIDVASKHAIGISVQTVVTSLNDSFEHMVQLRDWLSSRGVKNWILHTVVDAGSAHRVSNSNSKASNLSKTRKLFPSPDTSTMLKKLVDYSVEMGVDMDIRTTNASSVPNSVFLIGSAGSLFVQGFGDYRGKKQIVDLEKDPDLEIWSKYSDAGHVSRYANLDVNSESKSFPIDLLTT